MFHNLFSTRLTRRERAPSPRPRNTRTSPSPAPKRRRINLCATAEEQRRVTGAARDSKSTRTATAGATKSKLEKPATVTPARASHSFQCTHCSDRYNVAETERAERILVSSALPPPPAPRPTAHANFAAGLALPPVVPQMTMTPALPTGGFRLLSTLPSGAHDDTDGSSSSEDEYDLLHPGRRRSERVMDLGSESIASRNGRVTNNGMLIVHGAGFRFGSSAAKTAPPSRPRLNRGPSDAARASAAAAAGKGKGKGNGNGNSAKREISSRGSNNGIAAAQRARQQRQLNREKQQRKSKLAAAHAAATAFAASATAAAAAAAASATVASIAASTAAAVACESQPGVTATSATLPTQVCMPPAAAGHGVPSSLPKFVVADAPLALALGLPSTSNTRNLAVTRAVAQTKRDCADHVATLVETLKGVRDTLGAHVTVGCLLDVQTPAGSMRLSYGALEAIARGSWILTPSYIYASLEHGHWVGEEAHALPDAALDAVAPSLGAHAKLARLARTQLPASTWGTLAGEHIVLIPAAPVVHSRARTRTQASLSRAIASITRAAASEATKEVAAAAATTTTATLGTRVSTDIPVPGRERLRSIIEAAGGAVCNFRDARATACVVYSPTKTTLSCGQCPLPGDVLLSSAEARGLRVLSAGWVFDSIVSGGIDLPKRDYELVRH